MGHDSRNVPKYSGRSSRRSVLDHNGRGKMCTLLTPCFLNPPNRFQSVENHVHFKIFLKISTLINEDTGVGKRHVWIQERPTLTEFIESSLSTP